MGTKHVLWGSLCLFALFTASAAFADTVSGSGTAGFQGWVAGDLNNNGKPYWDNRSLDSVIKKEQNTSNVGFYLTDESPVPLEDAPGALAYWGMVVKSKKKTVKADPNFFFEGNGLADSAVLKLEADAIPGLQEFGWYDKTDPMHTTNLIFSGSASPAADATFSPSSQYGFYLKRGNETFYTESYLNPYKDRSHQHFVVFQDLPESTPTNEVYWIGIENSTRRELKGKEGGSGDYNDMLIRISVPLPVPEPSAAVLVLSGTSLILVLLKRHRK